MSDSIHQAPGRYHHGLQERLGGHEKLSAPSSPSLASSTKAGRSPPTARPTWSPTTSRVPKSAGLEVIIAAAGMSAALPGVAAAMTLLPVLGVPMEGKLMGGLDALLTIAQMPGGVPVGALAVGSAGAKNSALLAVRILANSRPELREKLRLYYAQMAEQIAKDCELHDGLNLWPPARRSILADSRKLAG